MITTKPPITNFIPFHITRVALLRQQREKNWAEALLNKPTIVRLDGSGVVSAKPRKKALTKGPVLPKNFASMSPEVQKIFLEQLGRS